MNFHYSLMEITASYDVLNESYSRIQEVDSSGDSEEEFPRLSSAKKWRNFFRRRKGLREYAHDEVASTPTGYWDISAEQFARALNLKPQFGFATSTVYSSMKCSKSDEALNRHSIEFEENYRKLESSSNLVGKDPNAKEKKRVRFASIKQLKSLIPMKSPHMDIKMLIVGDKNAGKTAIIERFVHGTYNTHNSVKTTSYETKLMKLQNKKQFCLHMFEVSGDISNAIVSQTCVSSAMGAIIVCDINETKAFGSIKKWKRDVDAKASQTKYGEIPCILLANKCDSPEINFNMCELDNYCSKQGILGWFDSSARNDFNIKNAFVYLMQIIIGEQRRLKSSAMVDANKRKHIMSNVNLGFRRRNNSYDEESTTML